MDKDYSMNIRFNGLKFKIDPANTFAKKANTHKVHNEVSREQLTHFHSNYEIFLICSGNGEISTINNKYPCNQSIIIIPPGLPHYTQFDSADIINFFFSFPYQDKSEEGLAEKITSYIGNNVCILPLNEFEELYAKRLFMIYCDGLAPTDEVTHLLPLLFSSAFSRIFNISKKSQNKTAYKNARIIEDYIFSHKDNKIQLSDLASLLHLCEKQVSRIIRTEFGCTLSELVIQNRMNIATMLLLHSNLNVQTVSEQVGYNSIQLFNRHFKRVIGVSPTEYRKVITKS